MRSIKFLSIMFRSIFNQDIIYSISKQFTRNMYLFYYKKRKVIKYKLKNFNERKRIKYHYYYH
jgi:hypothetical protein